MTRDSLQPSLRHGNHKPWPRTPRSDKECGGFPLLMAHGMTTTANHGPRPGSPRATARTFEVPGRPNPNGIPSISPGLGREADLPWVRGPLAINPIGVSSCQGVASHQRWAGRNPVGVGDLVWDRSSQGSPRRGQPWATGRNLFEVPDVSGTYFCGHRGDIGRRSLGAAGRSPVRRLRRSATLHERSGPGSEYVSKLWKNSLSMNREGSGRAPGISPRHPPTPPDVQFSCIRRLNTATYMKAARSDGTYKPALRRVSLFRACWSVGLAAKRQDPRELYAVPRACPLMPGDTPPPCKALQRCPGRGPSAGAWHPE